MQPTHLHSDHGNIDRMTERLERLLFSTAPQAQIRSHWIIALKPCSGGSRKGKIRPWPPSSLAIDFAPPATKN